MNWKIRESDLRIIVEEIWWERTHLYLTVKAEHGNRALDLDELVYYGVYTAGKARVRFDRERISENGYRLHALLTNNGENICLPFGLYRIYVCRGQDVLAECEMGDALLGVLDERSRIFTYYDFHKSYNVSFFVEEGYGRLYFRMHIRNLTEEPLTFPVNEDWKEDIKAIIDRQRHDVRYCVRRMYRKTWEKYHGDRMKNVLFLTVQKNQIGSNLKAVYDRMVERGLDKKFHLMIYSVDQSQMRLEEIDWESFITPVAQCGIIFVDDHVPAFDWIRVGKKSKMIQLWHGGAGFKSSGYSRWGLSGGPSPMSCHRQYWYGVVDSKKIAPFYAELWGINSEQVVAAGMPRIDAYLDKKNQETVTELLYQKYPLCKGKKVILFAPTFRGKNNKKAYYPYELIDQKRLYQACGDEYVVLFKAHPWVKERLEIGEQYQDKFLDVKDYPNINDLFYITDLLITDYSSGIYEYSLMHRPMLFFAFDLEHYEYTRGFHRSYEETAPGKICRTFSEVVKAINDKDFEVEKVEQFVEDHFDVLDGGASDRVIDWFLLGKIPKEIPEGVERKRKEMQEMAKLDFRQEIDPDEEEQ